MSVGTPILKICPLKHFPEISEFQLPTYATEGAVGMDVRACLPTGDRNMRIFPGERKAIPTGLAVQVPEGYELQVRPRSGISLKTDLLMVNSPGTIDTDYRGEVHVILGNFGKELIYIHHGDRVAQWVISPVVKPILHYVTFEELTHTKRGTGGFGSTGIS